MEYIICSIKDFQDKELDVFYSNMNPLSKQKINKYKNLSHKKQSIIGEYLLSKLLNKYSISYSDASFFYLESGKPIITNYPIYYSISHSSDKVIATISNHLIGVDIEKIRNVSLSTIHQFANKEEEEYILSSKKNQKKRLFEIYTLKEAYVKMMGLSILQLKDVSFTVQNNDVFCSDTSCQAHLYYQNNYVFSICQKKE